jgi:hypothetical protein
MVSSPHFGGAMRVLPNDRDILIQKITKAISELLDEMKRDPIWFEMGPEVSQAAFRANQVKHEAAAHCFKIGLSIGDNGCLK